MIAVFGTPHGDNRHTAEESETVTEDHEESCSQTFPSGRPSPQSPGEPTPVVMPLKRKAEEPEPGMEKRLRDATEVEALINLVDETQPHKKG